MINYNGKSVIVTGASGGMGKIICERLARQGANLAICSNDKDGILQLEQSLKSSCGVKAFAKAIDITKEAEVKEFFEAAAQANGKFSAMANLAGLSIPAAIKDMELSDYETVMDVNVKGTFLTGKYFAQNADKPAIIVNIGSVAAKNANANAPVYCTAKAAVNMLSQGMLLQMGSQDIRVTTINPGGTDTTFWGNRAVDKSRLMQAEDVAEIIMFALTSSPSVQIHDIYFESSSRF